MRILIAHEALAGAGGIESYLATVIPALVARGHSLALLHLTPRSDIGPVRLDHPEVPSAGVADHGLEHCLAWARQFEPDVCFSHNIRLLELDERLAVEWPTVKMMHGYFGTCISSQKTHSFPSIEPCTRTFGPACLGLYLPRHCGQLRPLRMLRHYRWASSQHDLLARYAHVVVASEHMAREFEANGAPPSKVTAAPLFPTIAAGGEPRRAPTEPTVLFAGRMTPLKGGDVLLRAMAIANRSLKQPAGVVMAGNGPEAGRWRSLACELGVSATFPGWLTGPERTAMFRNATVVAMPSLWPEPFGLTGLDAAVHGVPAVAFDAGGIRQWLRDGVSGRLVRERGSAGAMAAALIDLLSRPDELDRLSAGAVSVAAELSPDAHVGILESVFRRSAREAVRQA